MPKDSGQNVSDSAKEIRARRAAARDRTHQPQLRVVGTDYKEVMGRTTSRSFLDKVRGASFPVRVAAAASITGLVAIAGVLSNNAGSKAPTIPDASSYLKTGQQTPATQFLETLANPKAGGKSPQVKVDVLNKDLNNLITPELSNSLSRLTGQGKPLSAKELDRLKAQMDLLFKVPDIVHTRDADLIDLRSKLVGGNIVRRDVWDSINGSDTSQITRNVGDSIAAAFQNQGLNFVPDPQITFTSPGSNITGRSTGR